MALKARVDHRSCSTGQDGEEKEKRREVNECAQSIGDGALKSQDPLHAV